MLIVLLGYALRAYAVAAPALRDDEAFSVGFASQAPSKILTALARAEPNPPLYWFLLHGWMQVAGRSEIAVRWPSVLAGTVTVALVCYLGSIMLRRSAAQFAALLAALNPFLVWYAQDARVYALLTVLVLAAVCQTWRAMQRNRLRDWVMAGLWWWLALFAHYFAALPLAAIGAAFLLAPASRKRWREGLALASGIGAAYAPWAIYVSPLLVGHSKGWISPVGPTDAIWRLFTVASSGAQASGAAGWLPIAGGVLLALAVLAGSLNLLRRRRSAAIWLIAFGVGAPSALWLISLVRPVFAEQYFIGALPGVAALGAAGALAGTRVKGWGKGLSWTVALGLSLAALASLQNYYFDPAFSKSPRWRDIARYLADTTRPDELVLLNQPLPAFYYYYDAPMPVETSPPGPLSEAGLPKTEAQLAGLRDRYQHVRFFFSPHPAYDPDGFVSQWLEACCEKTTDTFVYGFRVQTFDTPSGSLAARQSYSFDFERGITLTGYRLVNPRVRVGEPIHLTLYWTAREKIGESYTVFVHVLAADGFNVVGQDNPPRGGAYPTDQWPAGAAVIDPHPVPLPADMPPGDYRLDVGLYRLETGERLIGQDASGAQADHVLLPIVVTVGNP